MEKSTIITLCLLAVIILITLLITNFKSDKRIDIKRKMKFLPFWSRYFGIITVASALIIHWNDSSSDPSTVAYF